MPPLNKFNPKLYLTSLRHFLPIWYTGGFDGNYVFPPPSFVRNGLRHRCVHLRMLHILNYNRSRNSPGKTSVQATRIIIILLYPHGSYTAIVIDLYITRRPIEYRRKIICALCSVHVRRCERAFAQETFTPTRARPCLSRSTNRNTLYFNRIFANRNANRGGKSPYRKRTTAETDEDSPWRVRDKHVYGTCVHPLAAYRLYTCTGCAR